MNRAERNDLIRLVKARAQQARSEADQRKAVLLNEAEELMAAEFEARDEMWAEAVAIAGDAAAKANDLIRARCQDLGIPARFAPSVDIGWSARSPEFRAAGRRAELRKLAQSRVETLTKTAKTMIDRQALDAETALLAGGLESEDARAHLVAMKTVEELMPTLTLDDIGVKHWQPDPGAAAALLTPGGAMSRRRKLILQAIERSPAASNRQIAAAIGCDPKTVAAARRAGEVGADGGELAGEVADEFPADDGEDGEFPTGFLGDAS
jgi:hypothetical protein